MQYLGVQLVLFLFFDFDKHTGSNSTHEAGLCHIWFVNLAQHDGYCSFNFSPYFASSNQFNFSQQLLGKSQHCEAGESNNTVASQGCLSCSLFWFRLRWHLGFVVLQLVEEFL